MIGISSAFFIGFFHERDEPVRSSVRAFATYRLSDAGLLIATVTTFELLGSARFSALRRRRRAAAGRGHGHRAAVPACRRWGSPRSCRSRAGCRGRWKARPPRARCSTARCRFTPDSSCCCACGRSSRCRSSPGPSVLLVGLATALYAAAVVRVHTDAKGALAHATLAQVGLILAEICLGWTALALTHLVCHAFLRLGQYLKAPNTIHDSHRLGHGHARPPSLLERWSPVLAARRVCGVAASAAAR